MRVSAPRAPEIDIDIGAGQVIAEIRYHVRVGDLRRDERVDRYLAHLGIDEVHALHARTGSRYVPVDSLELLTVDRVALADEHHVGMKQVVNDGAEGDELRAVAQTDITPDDAPGALLECLAGSPPRSSRA